MYAGSHSSITIFSDTYFLRFIRILLPVDMLVTIIINKEANKYTCKFSGVASPT